jgi:hypothetical protein
VPLGSVEFLFFIELTGALASTLACLPRRGLNTLSRNPGYQYLRNGFASKMRDENYNFVPSPQKKSQKKGPRGRPLPTYTNRYDFAATAKAFKLVERSPD